jgi:hypothetical protein
MAGFKIPDDSPRLGKSLTFEVFEGDVTTFAADLIAFKYAQGFYGADSGAAQALAKVGIDVEALQPKVGEHRLVEPGSALAARQVLFLGVPPLSQLGYREIRNFGTSVIRILSDHVPDCRHLAMTLHGPGIGLDEVEALFSMLTGCMEAVADRPPPNLKRISVVERDAARVRRLRRALREASHHSRELSVTEAEGGWLVQLEGVAGLASASTHKTHLLFVRPADDSTAGHVATWGQAVLQLTSGFTTTDLYGSQAGRADVDQGLPTASSLFYFGHGTDTALVAAGATLVDQQNLTTLAGGIVVAIACYAAVKLGPVAGASHPNVVAFLGFDDELGFPLPAPLPMGMAVIDGLRCLLTQGHDVNCSADQLRHGFDRARVDYKTNGPLYGLSPSDTRTAWLYAKSNRYSVQVHGDQLAML